MRFVRLVDTWLPRVAILACGLIMLAGCEARKKGDTGGKQAFIDIGTSPAGGVFNPVGTAIAESLNQHKGENDWKAQAKGTKGSQENIRLLDSGELQLAISNAAISYFALEGKATWDKQYNVRTIATLAPNVAMFVTKQDSGIKTIADLKGKKVVVGPPGAGFEMFVGPILEAHGVSFDDFEKANAGQNDTVDMLADGQADAAFLGGAVPTSSIERFCNEQDVYFIPFDESVVKQLGDQYAFFWPIKITQDKYRDLQADFNGLNVGSMHLITSADQDDDMIYQITKTMWENRATTGHPVVKKSLTDENATRNTGVPFHPGAIRFYKEIGIWPTETEDNKEP